MKFSIITVVKNDQENISKTITSVLSQNYKNFEYIILDGFSKDKTYEEIKKFKKFKRIKIIRTRDKNLYDGINKAIKISNGKYIGLMHSGDLYTSNSILSKVSKEIKSYDLLSSNLCFFNNNKVTRYWCYDIKKLDKWTFFKIAHTTLFVKRKILKKNPYNIKYKISSDTDLIIKLLSLNLKYKYFNFLCIFMKDDGLSTSFSNLLRKVREDLKIYFYHFKFLFFYFYISKILFKLFKLLTQNKNFASERKLKKLLIKT